MFHQTQVFKSTAIELPEVVRQAETPAASMLELERLWRAVRNHKGLITASVAVSLLAAIAFIIVAKPQYTATTQILIDPSDLRAVENGLTPTNQLSDLAVLQVESQVRVLTSDNVLRRVIAARSSTLIRNWRQTRPRPGALQLQLSQSLLASLAVPGRWIRRARR